MSLEPHSKAEFEKLAGASALKATAPLNPLTALTVDLVRHAIEAQGLDFGDDRLPGRIHAAVTAGKHLLLQGPPGTGKTELAIAIANAATAAGVCRGHAQVAGSSDWTPADTLGTYRLNRDKDLEFTPGLILDAVDRDRWVVLDELNRAAIDQAMGSLFTVLSGQAVVLRFEEVDAAGDPRTVAIVPENQLLGDTFRHYEIAPSWRIVATMNTLDIDLLFEISQAFLRRFAIINIAGPPIAVHRKLLKKHETANPDVDGMVQRLPTLPGAPLGPAITLDCAKYAAARVKAGEMDHTVLAEEILESFIRPQLVHLSALDQELVANSLASATPPAGAPADGEPGDE